MEWWGLYEDDELVAVGGFFNPPDVWDFDAVLMDYYEYEVARVNITRSD